MFKSRRRAYPAIIVCALGLGAGAAWGDDTSTQQMQQQIAQLQNQVKTLQAQQAQTQPDATATKNQIVQGADSQSQLLAPMSGGAGYDSATGFHIASDDGNFYAHLWALMQFRGVWNDVQSVQQRSLVGGGLPTVGTEKQLGAHETDGWEIHNMEMGLNGHVVSPNLEYYLSADALTSGGGLILEDAYGTYRLTDNCPIKIKLGQFVDPVWHETNVDDGHLLLADRSLTSALIGGTFLTPQGIGGDPERVEGIGATYTGDRFHGEFDFHNGYNSQNDTFENTPATTPSPEDFPPPENFGWSGRIEYKVFGGDSAWDSYSSMSAKDGGTDMLVVGGGFDWSEAQALDNLWFTFDAQYEMANGLNLYAAFLEDYVDASDNSNQPPTNPLAGTYVNMGLVAQAGYLVNSQWEPFARYDYTNLAGGYVNTIVYGNPHESKKSGLRAAENMQEFTLGVNYYLFGQRAKVTGDIGWLPEGSPVNAPAMGILRDDDHSEFVGRIQFQLMI